MLPVLTWANRQRAVKVDLPMIGRIVEAEFPLVPMGFPLFLSDR
jgi:hypothetical protein